MPSPYKKTIIITGANRGIGLGFVKYYLAKNFNVIATCRDPAKANDLKELSKKYQNLIIEKLDVSSPANQEQLLQKYKSIVIDILINNAGIYPEDHKKISISNTDPNWINNAFQTNCLGAFYLIHNFKDNLLKSDNPIVINMASQAGSISQTKAGFGYSYRISKAALNMLTKTFAAECPEIITISLRPGWVKTKMGGDNATIEISDSIQAMTNLIENLRHTDSGKFLDAQGNIEQW
ncbi:SDR family oxidoreductase [Francisella philomiragia]|uniref:Short chain dehydrogenase family protein n=1 Tax=Francisella philomiragia TaxID=28110 RepID=A0A0B6CTY7_9GAMM|nr:SDR family oxidoreductase [Francisella philomiragia]AJI52330.1 short chain dehydrogenase family protein [Francisella philomiragia]MBY7735131.1 SDR family oxidoreductase [Francisella philomiragia]